MATDAEITEADHEFTEWMRSNLHRAAEHFGVRVDGEPVLGWRLRSISAPVDSVDGRRWLRVVSEQPQWAEGDWWTGNADANAITGIPKPHVLDSVEWEIPEVRRQRAEVMTFLPGEPCSATDALQGELDLSASWWSQLRHAVDALRRTPTTRVRKDDAAVCASVRDTLGVDIEVRRRETVHGDLHWSNLLHPRFGLLDWELWGRGPAGTDAASLYCYSLLTPDTAATVWDTFADLLNGDDGRVALLYVCARLIRRTEIMGDHPELADPLRDLVATL